MKVKTKDKGDGTVKVTLTMTKTEAGAFAISVMHDIVWSKTSQEVFYFDLYGGLLNAAEL